MEQIIIYGAGKIGIKAFETLHNQYEILFFVDKDEKKQGQTIGGVLINSPEILHQYENVKIVIASVHYPEILRELSQYKTGKIVLYEMNLKPLLNPRLVNQLDNRTIDLGQLFLLTKELSCKELTFLCGGSLVLDYLFLKQVAILCKCKSFLEIGTYIGESINNMAACCEELYSVTAPPDAPFSMRNWCQKYNLPDYSERLAYSEKIKHFYTDSKTFDFSSVGDKVDLYFIDGDHSYEGVPQDTQNVFANKKQSAIVVWHDFKCSRNEYNTPVIQGVSDAIGEEFSKVYVTDNNLCGIYLPEKYRTIFPMNHLHYTEKDPLYTYDVMLKCKIRD